MVLATGVTADGRERPVIFRRRRGLGQLLYVGLPLGYLKGCSDDLPAARGPAPLPLRPGPRAAPAVHARRQGRAGGELARRQQRRLGAACARCARPDSCGRTCGSRSTSAPDPTWPTPGDGRGFDAAGRGAAGAGGAAALRRTRFARRLDPQLVRDASRTRAGWRRPRWPTSSGAIATCLAAPRAPGARVLGAGRRAPATRDDAHPRGTRLRRLLLHRRQRQRAEPQLLRRPHALAAPRRLSRGHARPGGLGRRDAPRPRR